MFPSKKEFEKLKKEFEKLSESHNHLADVVIQQQEEINELKKPKEPEYMA